MVTEPTGRQVIITGGSRGIGRDLVLHLAKMGYGVIFTYNTGVNEAEMLSREISELGRECTAIRADLSRREDLRALAGRIRESSSVVEALINNAGVYTGHSLSKTTDEDWDRVLSINLDAPFILSRDLSGMIVDGGSIVNIASVYGIRSDPWGYGYQASKAAIIHLTRALAKELGPRIRVNAVAPGYIKTSMNEDAWNDRKFAEQIIKRTPMKRWGEVSDISSSVAFLIDRANSFITGHTLVVDGGISL